MEVMSTPLELARKILSDPDYHWHGSVTLAAALIEAAKDTERLDWISNEPDFNTLECGRAFPDRKWTIWGDLESHLGRGETLRAAIDAAKEEKAWAQITLTD